jgi:hypothetical protein
MMRTEFRRRFWPFVLLCLGAVLCGPGQARGEAGDYSMSIILQYGALFAPDQVNPIAMQFRNRTAKAVVGEVRLPLGQEPAQMALHVPVTVPAQSRVKATAFPYLTAPPDPGKPVDRRPALSMAGWYDEHRARIDRTELLGEPLNAEIPIDPSGISNTGILLSITGETDQGNDSVLLEQLSDMYAALKGAHYTQASLSVSTAPRQWIAFAACRVVALRGFNPDELDQAQRMALLDFVRAGGVLLIASPRTADRADQSWLAPYLPVRLIGERQAREIQQPSGPMKLGAWEHCSEAVEGDGTVTLRDKDYVHAAWKSLGLGRIAYISFPASSLESTDPRTKVLWRDLLAMDRLHTGLAGTPLQREYGRLLEPMLGKPTAPWSMAALTIGLYAAVVLGVQLIWRGPRRPRAFAVSLVVALVVAGVFVVLTRQKVGGQSLQSARLTVMDLGAGGGKIEEIAAFGGKSDEKMSLGGAEESVSLRPVYNSSLPVVIYEHPSVAPEAGVTPERISRVWNARNPLPASWSIPAVARFGPDGLKLRLRNQTPLQLDAAQFAWRHERFVVGKVTDQEQTITLNEANHRPPNEYTTSGGITSQDERLKGDILASLLNLSDQTMFGSELNAPYLVGWATGAPELLRAGDEIARRGQQSLVRVPVLVDPPARGEIVRIDPWFSSLVTLGQRGLPYDGARGEWLQSNMAGGWTFAMVAPPQVGRLVPQKVRLEIDIAAPQHRLVIRRGQGRVGKDGAENPAGPIIGQWDGPLGMRTAEFTCDSSDFDEQGRIWFLLQTEATGTGSMGVPPNWRIHSLGASIEGQVQELPAASVPGVLR